MSEPHVPGPQTYESRPQTRPPRWRRLAAVTVPPLAFGLFLLGAWYYASYVWLQGSRRILLAPPHKVISRGFLEWKSLRKALDAMAESGTIALRGLLIAILLGLALAVAMSQARSIERAVFPYMVMLQAVPILAMTPLIGLLFGTGRTSRVIVCVIFALFPIVVNVLFGLSSADQGHHDLFTLNRASRWTRLRMLMIPAALPAAFAGLRIAASLAVIGGIVCDFFFGRGKRGLGMLINEYKGDTDSARMIGAILVAAVFGVCVFLVFGWIQRRSVGRWYEGASQRSPG